MAYTMLITIVQTHKHAKHHRNPLKNDVASLTSSLNMLPAIVPNTGILHLLKFVFIYWCEYYLTLSSTQRLLVLCIQAFRDWCLSKTLIHTLCWCKQPTTPARNLLACYDLVVILHQWKRDSLNLSILCASQNDASDVTSWSYSHFQGKMTFPLSI